LTLEDFWFVQRRSNRCCTRTISSAHYKVRGSGSQGRISKDRDALLRVERSSVTGHLQETVRGVKGNVLAVRVSLQHNE